MDVDFALYAGVLLFGTFISAISQVILKKASRKVYKSFIAEYLNFPVISAYAIFVISTLLCIVAYKVIPLSLGPVLESTSYLYVTIFGYIFFKEAITLKKIIALCFILGGVFLTCM